MKSQKTKGTVPGQKSIASFFRPSQPSAPKAPLQEPAPNKPEAPAEAPKPKKKNPETPKQDPTAPQAAKAPVKAAAAAEPQDEGQQPQDGSEIVGKRIAVFWPGEKSWFEGQVKKFNADKAKHFLEYDDGDAEWLRLSKEKWKVVADSKPKTGRNQVLVSDDEDMEEEEEEEDDAQSGSDWEAEEGAAGSEMDEDDGDDGDEESEEESDADSEGDGGSPVAPRASGKKRKAAPAKAPARTPAAKRNAPAPAPASSGPGRTPGSSVRVTPAGSSQHLRVTPVQPAPEAKATMKAALSTGEVPVSSPSGAGGTGASAALELTGEAARFSARDAKLFPHLRPENLRDSKRRRPDDPDYDPRTVHVPDKWYKDHKPSPGQMQWWKFKSSNFDSVLMFKIGKFYELYEMDAHVGAEVLGLSYMKGDQPHCGFPEKNYHQNAELLARAGHRVLIVEQTETPDMLAARNEELKRKGQKKDTVVMREAVAVLTRATMMDPEMLASNPEASYLLSITEAPNDGGDPKLPVRIGFVVTDCPTGEIVVGQWADDELRSRLRAHLTAFKPVEVVMPEGGVSPESALVMRGCLRNPRLNRLRGPEGAKAWDGGALKSKGYFKTWPTPLQSLEDAGTEGEVALAALGGLAKFLCDLKLDQAVLSLGKVELLPESDCVLRAGEAMGGDCPPAAADEGPEFMALDGAALENLEILENADGGAAGTLISALDNCATPCGRRLLRQWLLRPLGRVSAIEERQDAVADLMDAAMDSAGEARRLMAGMADLERGLARLQTNTNTGRYAAHVILYEDQGRRRVASMVCVLRGLKALLDATACFDPVRPDLRSSLLTALVTPGQRFPDMAAVLEEFEKAADWDKAIETGKVLPRGKGIDDAFDEAERAADEAEDNLKAYLKGVKSDVSSSIKYASANKDTHLLEVPEDKASKVPRSWELKSNKKGFRRYMTQELQALVAEREEAEESMEVAVSGILSGLIERFNSHQELWSAAVSAASHLDALASLAHAAFSCPTSVCRPKFVQAEKPFFDAKSLCHPAGLTGRQGCFVPNDISIGGEGSAPFMLLTGANMGGKSTLLRQVSLSAVMAQVGAWVPAESLQLSPIDAVHVRMGARDHIMAGQSTFMVELSETATMLRRATSRSLVLLDELGRGTSTSDGCAIASAVLSHVVRHIGCMGLFATHYHRLAEDHKDDPAVAICHMGARVIPASNDGEPDEVCFLYKLTSGACPKSYGHNVARLAGLPASVVAQAAVKAAELEAMFRERAQRASGRAEHGAPPPGDAASGGAGGEGDAKAVDMEALAGMQSVIAAASQASLPRLISIWKQLSASSA